MFDFLMSFLLGGSAHEDNISKNHPRDEATNLQPLTSEARLKIREFEKWQGLGHRLTKQLKIGIPYLEKWFSGTTMTLRTVIFQITNWYFVCPSFSFKKGILR